MYSGRLADDPQVKIWRALSKRALSQEVSFFELLGNNKPKRYIGAERPLAFLHVPKTGGASIIQVLETFFDVEDICPAYNPPDFDLLSEPERYRLFRGHFLARQADRLPEDTQCAVLLRDPADFVLSMRNFMNRVTRESYVQMQDEARTPDTARGESSDILNMLESVTKSSTRTPFDLLTNPSYEEFLLYCLVFVRTLVPKTVCDAFTAERQRSGELAFAEEPLRTAALEGAIDFLNSCHTVTTLNDIHLFLYLICWDRMLPAPAELPEIHRYERSEKDFVPTHELNDVIKSRWPEEFVLFDSAQQRSDHSKQFLMKQVPDESRIRECLNERFKENYFHHTESGPGFHLTAQAFWPGPGWGMRQYRVEKCSRTVADHPAILLAVLDCRCDYILRIDYESAEITSARIVLVTANGKPLQFSAERWTRRGSLEMWYTLPAAALLEGGKVELSFQFPAHDDPEAFRLAGVYCQPKP